MIIWLQFLLVVQTAILICGAYSGESNVIAGVADIAVHISISWFKLASEGGAGGGWVPAFGFVGEEIHKKFHLIEL